MSMTREEAIVQIKGLKKYCEDMADSDESGSYVFDLDVQALDLALSALRPVSREQVEKVCKGKWVPVEDNAFYNRCSKCGKIAIGEHSFCRNCGAPMTDEAVDMMIERLKEVISE